VGGMAVTIAPTTVNLVTWQEQIFTAAVTGSVDTTVTWSVTPTTGAQIITSGTFMAWIAGTYTVTATSNADPSVSATVTFTVAPAPLAITGRISDGRVQVSISQGPGGYDGATVTVTTSGGTITLTRLGTGFYENTAGFALPPAGQTVTVAVTGPSAPSVTGIATVPMAPTITAPALNSTPPAAGSITVQWTSPAPDPQEFRLDGQCGNQLCIPGPLVWPTAWATVAGGSRSAVLAGGFFPAGNVVSMALNASNKLAFTGNVLPGSSVSVDARATGPTWWQFTPIGSASMTIPRFALASATDGTSKILVVGGMKYTTPTTPGGPIYYDQTSTVRTVESYDLGTGLWSTVMQTMTVPPLPFYPAAVQTGTGLFLVGGQTGASMIGIRSWLEYQWYFNTWWAPAETTSWPWLATPRTMAAIAAPAGNLCLPAPLNTNDCFHYMVTGGDDGTSALNTTEYFTSMGARVAGPAMNTPRFGHVAVMVGNRYFVIGGRNTLSGTALNDMEYCDVTADANGYHISAWTVGTAPPTGAGRYNSTAAVFMDSAVNGRIYVMGGAANTQVRSEVYVYNTATNSWSQATSLTTPVAQAATAVMGTKIYLVGGDMGNPAGAYGGVQVITP
jgi:hypothetical protein